MQSSKTTRGKGYVAAVNYSEDSPFIRGALHIEMDTQNWVYDDDKSAAQAAEQDGVKLIYGIPYVEDGIYLDTAENRLILDCHSRTIRTAMRKRKS